MPSRTSSQAVPTLGWPANGQLERGREDAHPRVARRPPAGSTKVVSERFISLAMACICTAVSPSASGNTASGLPANGRSVNTSTW